MGQTQSTRKLTLVDDDKAGVIKLSESLAHRLRGQIEGQQAVTAERTSPAAAQEPLPPPPPPPTRTPFPSPPQPSLTKKSPKIPDVVKIPVVPEPPTPKTTILETVPQDVTPEPLVPALETPGQPDAPLLPPVDKAPKALPPALALPVPHQVEGVESPATPDINVPIKAGPGPTLAQPGGNIPPWSLYAEEAHLMVMRLRSEKEEEIKNLNLDWHDKMDAREKEFTKMGRLSEEEVASALKEVENLFMKASCTPVCQNQQEVVMNCYQDHPRQSLRCAREVEHFTQCVDLSRLQSIMKQQTAH